MSEADEAGKESENERAVSKGTGRKVLGLLLEALLLCNVLVLFNTIFVSFFISDVASAIYMISLITLLEGGLGLVFGGLFVVAAGPTVSKIGEKVFHGAPYSAKRARDSDANARVFFFFSVILIFVGFLIPYILSYPSFG